MTHECDNPDCLVCLPILEALRRANVQQMLQELARHK